MSLRRISLLLVVGVCLWPVPTSAQAPPSAEHASGAQPAGGSARNPESWLLADRIYYEPLLAEQRAARIFLLFPGFSKAFPHSENRENRFAWQVTMGREIPIYGWQTASVGAARMPKGQWGVGLWVPIAFHMIEDFKDESNPIVDTDYRFGSMVKFQLGLTDKSWLSARFVPWAHESTHLGDEYTIIALRQPTFERVNVSYEYREYGISYEMAFRRREVLTVRHGGISLLDNEKGYYSNHLLGSEVPTLTPSRHNYEPSFGVEYRMTAPPLARRQIIASVDFRNRLQYSFHQPASGEEQRRPTWTIAVGRAAVEGDQAFLRSYFGYFTHGVNPYGQLREQYPYWAAGIGWIFQ